MRKMSIKYADVSSTAATVTVTGTPISSICVTSMDVAVPIYFRCDGVAATVRGEGCHTVIGVGGVTEIEVEPASSVTVSLISEGTGHASIAGTDAP